MNYNRRSTRPDAHFYRDSRKIRGAARTRGAAVGAKPVAALIVLAVLATIVYVLFLR
jgi:hypothetical protein